MVNFECYKNISSDQSTMHKGLLRGENNVIKKGFNAISNNLRPNLIYNITQTNWTELGNPFRLYGFGN